MATFSLIKNEPPIYLINNTYTESDRNTIFNEIVKLYPNLQSKDKIKSAVDSNNNTITSKQGMFLDTNNIIVNKNRNMYSIFKKFNHWFYKENEPTYTECISDSTLLSYYKHNDYYDTHCDESYITAITWFYNQPKNFEGGDLVFPKYRLQIECKDNTTVVFPGWIEHAVTPLNLIENKELGGRFALSQFFYHDPVKRRN